MQLEGGATPGPDRRCMTVDGLAMTLLSHGADQEVRALEALAGTLVRRMQQARRGPACCLAEPASSSLIETVAYGESRARLQLCRRIARRALGGGLRDPAPDATAFHRVDENPAWARHLLPSAIIGSFLFYHVGETRESAESLHGR